MFNPTGKVAYSRADAAEAGNAVIVTSDITKAGLPGYIYDAGDKLNPKDALGAAKPQMGFIPVAAMDSVARVMELGAKKYGPYNWRTKPVKLMVYAHAGLRHLFKWISGETIDEESGQPHIAHFVACGLIMLDAMATNCAVDDRTWPKDPSFKREDGPAR